MHTCALRTDGTVACFGRNESGQLGIMDNLGTYFSNPQPSVVPGLANVTEIATGSAYTCALKTNHTVACFGNNLFGQLGIEDSAGQLENQIPTTVPGLTGVAAITAGDEHTCALKLDGTVACFGNNAFGQLGTTTNNGTNEPNPIPTTVPGLTDVSAIVAGGTHTCALTSTGNVTCFGSNWFGQLGNTTGNETDEAVPTPTPVVGLSNVTALTAGRQHTCALKADRTVACFGYNGFGQLGTATNNLTANPNPVPTTVAGLTNVTSITARYRHTCAGRADGTVACFGWNRYGEIGLLPNFGTIANPVPTTVAGLDSVKSLTSGDLHTCALRADRSVVCFGFNAYGQLGNDTNDETDNPNPQPLPVVFPSRRTSA
jgi:alpha-tubulin suppressor-like RCC1 family protein